MADGAVFLAVDLGAGSGRIIAGLMLGGRLSLEEVYRFENEPVEKSGNLYWDFGGLWAGVLEGLRLSVVRYGAENISSIGVDTWGVDYGFIDKSGQLLGEVRHYRDPRTKNMYENLAKRVSKDVIFEKTGIQFMNINTLPQMCAEVKDPDSLLPLADQFLMVPDLINLSLTGQAFCERTNASTTQFYNPTKKDWSRTLFEALKLPLEVAPKLVSPGTDLGMVKASVRDQTGLSAETRVVTVGAHDTASAVAAVPAERGTRFAYLSSGTWSLLGVELEKPIIDSLARSYNLTNEVGVFDTIRLLKNINGLWVVQECRRVWKEQGNDWSYRDLGEMAAGAKRLQSFIDPDDVRFAGRCNMPLVIQDYCRETRQDVPEGPAEILRLVTDSLAMKIRFVLERLEEVIGYRIEVLHIIGGGGQNDQLNKSIASSINRPVVVGPYEATAAGNVMMQKVALDGFRSLGEGRDLIRESFQTRRFEPAHPDDWATAYVRFRKLLYCDSAGF